MVSFERRRSFSVGCLASATRCGYWVKRIVVSERINTMGGNYGMVPHDQEW